MENAGSHPPSLKQDSLPPSTTKKPGGWRAIKYILGNETFEKLASMGLLANLTVYLRSKFNLNGIFLVNVVTIWSGSSNVTSIGGAVVSDVYLGRFRTLLFGSIASFLGMTTITLTAAVPNLRPSTCQDPAICEQPRDWQLAILFIGLGLIAIGAGGIRPCNIAFGADQFDTRTRKGRAQLESFFNWWYFLFTIALLIALTGVVYVQTNVSWIIGFSIPTACLAFSITIFLIGRHTYVYKTPEGSIFVEMAKVVIAAFRKRKVDLGQATEQTFYNPPSDDLELDGQLFKPVLTDRFKCLSKAAAIIDPSELDAQGMAKNGWTLCSLEKVEQLKSLVGIVPVWCSGIGCFLVMDQQSTFGILQAIQMNASIGPHFKVPPAWMGITSMLALSIWIFIYERLYIPWSRKTFNKAKRLTMVQRIKIGIVFSILCMLAAGLVERKRKELALKDNYFVSPLSIGLLLPQFVLSGLTEGFAAVAVMEFFTLQMPESMRGVAGAVFFLSLSIASYLSSLIVNIIHTTSGKYGRSPWLGGHDLNKNKLDYYYFLIAILAALNFVYFTFFASKYVSCGKAIDMQEEVQLSSSNSMSRTMKDEGDNSHKGQ